MLREGKTMRRFVWFVTVLTIIVVVGSHLGVRAHAGGHGWAPWDGGGQSSNWSTGGCRDDEGDTHSGWWGAHQERVCETRTTTLKPTRGKLGVQTENGGIDVVGEDRADVVVEARVQAWAGSQSDARDILHQVEIATSGDSIRDRGPHFHMNKGYAVSYKLRVPRRFSVDLHTMNGGIALAHVDGELHFETTNGGVELRDLAGDVHGQTVNGGLEIALSGDRWQGKGLNAETTNGGVELSVPEHYSAHLETGTVNGGIQVNFPLTVQGEIKNRLSTDIGGGGATIHAETTNGGVQLTHGSGAGGAQ
jgi:DUF4097 and DUF4098 domain-containing protein YvlB